MNKRTHVTISEQLVNIDGLVGSRRRSSFITEAAEEKLTRYRQMAAIKAAAGAWKDKDHPDQIRRCQMGSQHAQGGRAQI